MTKINIMLDTETWGLSPGCDIRSIGACVFDPSVVGGSRLPLVGEIADADGRTHFGSNCIGDTFYLACKNPWVGPFDDGGSRKYPLIRDPYTVDWWAKQSEEAQAAFANPVDLKEALERFNDWYYSLACAEPQQVRIWAHGSHFDVPILAAAYDAVGLPTPWHYRAPRDTRTIFDAAGVEDHSAFLARFPGPLGVQHHALDDAICQARAVCSAFSELDDWRSRV